MWTILNPSCLPVLDVKEDKTGVLIFKSQIDIDNFSCDATASLVDIPDEGRLVKLISSVTVSRSGGDSTSKFIAFSQFWAGKSTKPRISLPCSSRRERFFPLCESPRRIARKYFYVDPWKRITPHKKMLHCDTSIRHGLRTMNAVLKSYFQLWVPKRSLT